MTNIQSNKQCSIWDLIEWSSIVHRCTFSRNIFEGTQYHNYHEFLRYFSAFYYCQFMSWYIERIHAFFESSARYTNTETTDNGELYWHLFTFFWMKIPSIKDLFSPPISENLQCFTLKCETSDFTSSGLPAIANTAFHSSVSPECYRNQIRMIYRIIFNSCIKFLDLSWG